MRLRPQLLELRGVTSRRRIRQDDVDEGTQEHEQDAAELLETLACEGDEARQILPHHVREASSNLDDEAGQPIFCEWWIPAAVCRGVHLDDDPVSDVPNVADLGCLPGETKQSAKHLAISSVA